MILHLSKKKFHDFYSIFLRFLWWNTHIIDLNSLSLSTDRTYLLVSIPWICFRTVSRWSPRVTVSNWRGITSLRFKSVTRCTEELTISDTGSWETSVSSDGSYSWKVRETEHVMMIFFCLLWIDKARAKDKTYIWVSVIKFHSRKKAFKDTQFLFILFFIFFIWSQTA